MQTAVVDFSRYDLHPGFQDGYENQARYDAIKFALQKTGLMTQENTLLARRAPLEIIALCHDLSYLSLLNSESQSTPEGEVRQLSTGDVSISKYSFVVACYAAGAVLTGIDAVLQGYSKNAFCLVRPPGHHASRDKGEGFCLLNNVAIGARYAITQCGLQRVAIIDWDIHHGNGTENIVEEDKSILYISTHKASQGFYPGTGKENRGVNVLNLPMTGGRTCRDGFFEVFAEKVIPALRNFKPELILISAGFDAHRADPLGGYDMIDGGFNLVEKDFADLTEMIKSYADEKLKGRIVSVLEGGYNLDALAASVCAHVQVLSQPYDPMDLDG